MANLTEIIAPAFYAVHRDIVARDAGRTPAQLPPTAARRDATRATGHAHYWLKGGRGSTKSSFVSAEIPLGIMKHPDANAVVIRKVGLYLKDSVYEQLLWAIERLGVSHLWAAKLSPL